MSTTNEAFIKAYRHDPARTAAPTPVHARTPTAAAWQTSIAIVAADHALPATNVAAIEPSASAAVADDEENSSHVWATSYQPTIGKRPLSTFTAPSTANPEPSEATFTPETTISSFSWPRVCRTLWQQYGDRYQSVANTLATKCLNEQSLIGVTGLHAGDGCTTTLLTLAIALATRKERVILVDANFQSPRLAGALGVEPTIGWQDVLEHGVPVADAVIHAAKDGVDLLPLDTQGAHRHIGQRVSGLQTFITAGVLRYAYDVVLVDLGALLAPKSFATIDHLLQDMRIDAVLTVTDPRNAAHDDLVLAEELLDESGCELLGVIENRAAKPQAMKYNL